MLFSIVMPVWNAEAHLREAVQSILSQDCSDFELILIDDASGDSSQAIISDLRRIDGRVRAFRHPVNLGVSAARNTGISNARGQYIIFLDADDIMLGGALRGFASALSVPEQVDVVIASYLHGRADATFRRVPSGALPFGEPVQIEDMLDRLQIGVGYWASGASAFSLSLVNAVSLRFDITLTVGEDLDFFFRFLSLARVAAFSDHVSFSYRWNESSVMRNVDPKRAVHLVRGWVACFRLFEHCDDRVRSYFANNLTRNVAALLSAYRGTAVVKPVQHYCRLNEDIFPHTRGLQYRALRAMWIVLGYERGSVVAARFLGTLRRAPHFPLLRRESGVGDDRFG